MEEEQQQTEKTERKDCQNEVIVIHIKALGDMCICAVYFQIYTSKLYWNFYFEWK